MPSTFSTNLKIELMSTGENSGTWGTVTNTNLGTALEQAVVGYGNPNYSSDANLTITLTDSNAAQAARALVLNVTSGVSLSATRELVVPTIQKQYIVQNNTTGSQSITVKTSAGTGVTIPNGKKMHVYVNGTDVVQMDDFALIFNVDNLTLDGNTLSSTDSNGNIVLAPNGTGDVQLDADTVRVGDANANATITTNGTGDLILNTNAGTNSGSITIEDGVNGNIIIAPNGTGQVQITNAALDLTTIEVSNINAKDGTAAITIADSTGAVGISTAVTMSATTQNIDLGTSQTSGNITIGGTAQTGALAFGQSTKTTVVSIGVGATENAATKTINIGTFGVSGSTTTITIGSTNGTTTTLNGTVTAATLNSTTIDTTNLEVTNIKAKDGTASITLADSTGNVTVSPAFAVNGNTTLGNASTDTVQVNGYMGVGGGGAANSSRAINVESAALTGTVQTGLYSAITGTSSATASVRGFTALVSTAASAFTVTDVAGFWYAGIGKGAGSTITNAHGLYIADQTQGTNNYGITSLVSSGSNKWNIYASGTANNAFAGNVRVGSTTAPTNALDVTGAMTVSGNTTLGDASTDTVTVNGYMGVGGAGATSVGVYVASSALTGVNQAGVLAAVTGSSAATTSIRAVSGDPATAAAAYTCTDVASLYAANGTLGAGSTITNKHGLQIADQTRGTNNFGITSLVSSGTNKWNIYASGTAANYFAGNVLIGTATAGSFESGISPIAQVGGVGAAAGALSVTRYSAGGGATRLMLVNSRGTAGSPTILQNGDTIGQILFVGDDGTDLQTPAASISALVAGTPGANDMPGSLVFNTTADGASNPTERLRIDSSGNLGLGVTPSAWSSSWRAYGIAGGATLAGRSSNTDELYVTANAFNDGVWKYIATDAASQYYQDAGTHVWRTAPSGTAGNAITFTERANIGLTEMVVNDPGNDYDFRVESDTNTHALFVQGSDGNVGIGEDLPAYKLDVFSGTNNSDIAKFTGGQTAKGLIISTYASNGNDGGAKLSSTDSLAFATASIERARITSGGDVQTSSGGSVQIGGTAARATTAGTNRLDIFDGTAPVGTLANGVSFYSTAGEARVMDAAGNATLLSPHDTDTNEWIFHSKHTPTGKVLKIDVERLLKFVNDHFGLDAVHEFIEE